MGSQTFRRGYVSYCETSRFLLRDSVFPDSAGHPRARPGYCHGFQRRRRLQAAVTLINTETGVRSTQTTNGSGTYLFDLVLPGTYTVTVELPGFRTFVQKNVLVQTRGDVTVDARLEIGNTNETVTVEARRSRCSSTPRLWG